jgi:hypothetical protein
MPNGLTKPSDRFRQEIEPALDDYRRDPLSERLANNLARVIDHHLDWTFEYYQRHDKSRLNGATDPKSFRRQLLQQCPRLATMNDLSDSAHHRFLDRPSDPARVTVTSTLAYAQQPGPGGVQLYIRADQTLFSSAAMTAIDFWRNWND